MANQLAFYFDASACTDCKACQVACQDRHDLGPDITWRRVFQYGGGNWISDPNIKYLMHPQNVFSYSVSTACQHCMNPLCRDACPTAAITKRSDGVVVIDADRCIGCRYCDWACPYGAPQFYKTGGYMTKCDFCSDILARGGNPACVDACVMRCLDFGELDELQSKYGTLSEIEPLPPAKITQPALVITPHRDSQISGHGTGRIENLPEEV